MRRRSAVREKVTTERGSLMFEAFTKEQYRSLDHDAFVARKQVVVDLLNSGDLPEGVTDEMLYAEADMIEAEVERRSRANKLFNAKVEAVAGGAGKVIASTEERAMPKQEARAEMRDRDLKGYTDSREYKRALAEHILHRKQMPAEMVAKALAEYRSNDAVSLNQGYTNMTDPTFANTFSVAAPIPMTLSNDIAREMHDYGDLDSKVNRTSIQGGVTVVETELVGTAGWASDKETTPWYEDYDPVPFSFTAWQLEYRHARSLLAQAMMSDNYKDLSQQIASEFSRVLNTAVWSGDGPSGGKPWGISTDTRLLGTGTPGQSGYVAPKASIIEVTKEDLASWEWWVKALIGNVNRYYRGLGEWIMGDGTFKYVQTLKDDNNRPLANYLTQSASVNERFIPAINNRPVNLMDDSIVIDFDNASVGDIFMAYGSPKNYTLNTQPGMPMTTIEWDDHDHNLHKQKVSMAVDGRVTNPFGWVLFKKKASA